MTWKKKAGVEGTDKSAVFAHKAKILSIGAFF